MAITNGYATLADFKLRFWGGDTNEHQSDEHLEDIITAVSRLVDSLTGRRFYTTTNDETKYYSPLFTDSVYLADDILSVTTLKTDEDGDRTYEITWQTTDYDLMPYNAPPYTWLETTPSGSYSFPLVKKGLQIVGKFGYNATGSEPPEIKEAVLLGTNRMLKRLETPLGVTGMPSAGQLISQVPNLQSDPDFFSLIAPYRRIYG